MTSPNPALGFTIGILSGFCGREPGSDHMQACSHDHSGEAAALVRMIEQNRFPGLLRELLAEEGGADKGLRSRIEERANALQAEASQVQPR